MEFIVCSSPYADEVLNATTPRLSYVKSMYLEMKQSACSLPTPAQDAAYQEALAHVANALSRRTQIQGSVFSAGHQACSKKKSRKERLQDVFDLLTSLERNRLYDPPSDSEFQYYLLIKKYARSMINFFDAWNIVRDPASGAPKWSDPFYPLRYECFSSCYPLEHAEELESLVEHFADFAECVLDLDITDCNLIRPSMSINTNGSKETPESVVCQSRERSSVFYWHKFFLATLDLRTSVLAFGPPEEDERLSYLRALDVLDRHGNQLEDKMDIYSEELRSLFFERTYNGYSNLERHFKTTARALLKKLYITDCWESLLERAKVDQKEDDRILCLGKKLAQGCEISTIDLPGYIADIDRCVQIATMIDLLIHGRSSRDSYVFDYMDDIKHPNKQKKVAWGALHAVTLSNYGCGSILDENGNLLVFRDPPDEARRKVRYLGRGDGENENLKILRGIVEDLRCIGESAMEPEKEERQLMNKIWQKATSSVHFFTCATAFQQKRQVVQHGGLHNVNLLGLRAENRKESRVTREDVRKKFRIIDNDILYFISLLHSYKQGLEELEMLSKAEGKNIRH